MCQGYRSVDQGLGTIISGFFSCFRCLKIQQERERERDASASNILQVHIIHLQRDQTGSADDHPPLDSFFHAFPPDGDEEDEDDQPHVFSILPFSPHDDYVLITHLAVSTFLSLPPSPPDPLFLPHSLMNS